MVRQNGNELSPNRLVNAVFNDNGKIVVVETSEKTQELTAGQLINLLLFALFKTNLQLLQPSTTCARLVLQTRHIVPRERDGAQRTMDEIHDAEPASNP